MKLVVYFLMEFSANACLRHEIMIKKFIYFVLLIYCISISGCVAVSQRKSWQFILLNSKTAPTKMFISINLKKPVVWLPSPIVMFEVSTAKHYLLDIDFHTKDIQYKKLDSVRYEIQSQEKQIIATGVLPIIDGELSFRPYSSDVHRAQCTTLPLIVLGNHRKELNGSFTIYATNINNQKAEISMENVPLHYFKARISGFF